MAIGDSLIHVGITLFVVVFTLFLEHFAPLVFFTVMAAAARFTPLWFFVDKWRCNARYYTNDTSRDECKDVERIDGMSDDFMFSGLGYPTDSSQIRLVEEQLIIVHFLGRYVGWVEGSWMLFRFYGFAYYHYIYGGWYDWEACGNFRGGFFMTLEDDHRRAFGVWSGPGLNHGSGRTFPWIWDAFCKYRRNEPTAPDKAALGLQGKPGKTFASKAQEPVADAKQ